MKKAGHTHTHAPNAVLHSDPRTTQSSVVHPLQGAGRNPRERGRSLMPSNNLIRTFCGQEDERSTNRRRRKTHEQREAPRQRAGIRNSGTLMGDITPPRPHPSPKQIPKNHTSPTQIIMVYVRTGLGTPPVNVGLESSHPHLPLTHRPRGSTAAEPAPTTTPAPSLNPSGGP